MKILELRFKNLNSLYGEWLIDFRNPEYASNGIFALTGPTGAGKSTILDALCLALYGSTPRLGKITKSGNDIMSRQTGECYAEALFEAGSGLYRCHWSQHRSRKKAEGDLQAPRHEIAEGGGDGRVLENQLSRTAKAIQEKTGMDFDQFSRSILLAQGGFDTFLKADAEQKSKILEQITGTALYTDISRGVHERLREEKDTLALLQAESSGLILLSPEETAELEEEMRSLKKREEDAAARKKTADDAVLWRKGMDALEREISALEEEKETLEEQLNAFLPERNRLSRSLRAAELDAPYATLTGLRSQQKGDRGRLVETGVTLEQLTRDSALKKESYDKAAAAVLRIREEIGRTAALRQKVRGLDQSLSLKRQSLRKSEDEIRKDETLLARYRMQRGEELKRMTEAEEELETLNSGLREHKADEGLSGSLAVFEEQLGRLDGMGRELTDRKDALKKAGERAAHAEDALKRNRDTLKRGRETLERVRGELEKVRNETASLLAGRTLSEYRREKETLQMELSFRLRVAGLDGEREKLEDGRPCPLCGSPDHPYARGNFPRPDGTEVRIRQISQIIERAEELDASLRDSETAEKEALRTLGDAEKQDAGDAGELNAAQTVVQELSGRIENEETRLAELEHTILEGLKPFGIQELPPQIPALIQTLRERLDTWKERVRQKEACEKKIFRIEGELKSQDALIEAGIPALEAKKTAFEALAADIRKDKDERRQLFGDKDPDTEELRLEGELKKAEDSAGQIRESYEEVERNLFSLQNLRGDLEARIAGRTPELNELESRFPGLLKAAGFLDETEFLEARLTSEDRDLLLSQARGLDEKQADLNHRLKDREERLQGESDRKLSTLDLKTLEEESLGLQRTVDSLRDSLSGVKHRLAENGAAGERLREKLVSIEAQKRECLRWEKLHGLIGSSDGKKYRNFAQGLTFELMVSHANRQLGKMTDRYLLLRDGSEPLELNVMDNYQAGEIRSTRNLSGGESFIISLSLALGLSGMASRKVRVDSLFLDEGFGTLDEDALETALETLSSLQREGKLIGVISHVPALKERISTQITVSPLSGGRSAVSGPGCLRV